MRAASHRWPRTPALLILIGLFIGGACRAPSVNTRGPEPLGSPAPAPSGPELPSCRTAWAALPEPVRSYRFEVDSEPTAQGNQGYRGFASRLARPSCQKDWTVLLYMAADAHDMTGPALATLKQLEAGSSVEPRIAAASGPGADLVVQLDVHRTPGIRRMHIFSAPADSPSLAGDDPAQLRSPIVEWMEEETLPPAESLRRFLSWGVAHYPARRYMVVVWGHGLGWLSDSFVNPRGSDLKLLPGGLAFDESQNSVIDIPGLRAALLGVSQSALGGRPFDVFVADACLMQSIEVAAELTGTARFLLGSEAKFDYQGLQYPELMALLNGTAPLPEEPRCLPADASCAIAARLPHLVVAEPVSQGAPQPGGPPSEHSLFSVLDAEETATRLQPAMHQLGGVLSEYLREDPTRAIPLQELLAIKTGSGAATERYVPDFPGGTRDIGVFLSRLRSAVNREAAESGSSATPGTRRLLVAIDTARAALQRAVLGLTSGSRYREERFVGLAGLSVWLPSSERDLASRGPQFTSSRFYRSVQPASSAPPLWPEWLQRLFLAPNGPGAP